MPFSAHRSLSCRCTINCSYEAVPPASCLAGHQPQHQKCQAGCVSFLATPEPVWLFLHLSSDAGEGGKPLPLAGPVPLSTKPGVKGVVRAALRLQGCFLLN